MQREIDDLRRALRIQQAPQHHIIVLASPGPIQNDAGAAFGTKAPGDVDVATVCSSSSARGSSWMGFDDSVGETIGRVDYGRQPRAACLQEQPTAPPTPESLPWPSHVACKWTDRSLQSPLNAFARHFGYDVATCTVLSGSELEPMFIDTQELALHSSDGARARWSATP